MPFFFKKHYSRDEARALLPQIRKWLKELHRFRQEINRFDERISSLLSKGQDAGGEVVNQWLKQLANLKHILREFQKREIQIKDLDRGLIDFPAILAGKEVFLCWEQDEEDIEFWHDLTSGYAGRERIK